MRGVMAVRINVFTIVFAAVLGGFASVDAQIEPQLGTWTLDPALSKFSPGPPIKTQKVIYSAAGDGLRVSASGIDGTGKSISTEFVISFDGKAVPAKAEGYDTVSGRRLDDHTIEFTRSRQGKVVQTARRSVSKDGKIATLTITGIDDQGRKMHNVVVYKKQ